MIGDVETLSKIHIYTDAPVVEISFEPLSGQETSWTNLPGYDGRIINVKPHSLDEYFKGLPFETTTTSGGNPIETLSILSKAKYLILSCSSFGYVAALFNTEGKIYVPEEFWHPALKEWVTY